jgi:hypothetical protein
VAPAGAGFVGGDTAAPAERDTIVLPQQSSPHRRVSTVGIDRADDENTQSFELPDLAAASGAPGRNVTPTGGGLR